MVNVTIYSSTMDPMAIHHVWSTTSPARHLPLRRHPKPRLRSWHRPGSGVRACRWRASAGWITSWSIWWWTKSATSARRDVESHGWYGWVGWVVRAPKYGPRVMRFLRHHQIWWGTPVFFNFQVPTPNVWRLAAQKVGINRCFFDGTLGFTFWLKETRQQGTTWYNLLMPSERESESTMNSSESFLQISESLLFEWV